MHAKIISIEEIFDWYLKTIEIKLDRKPVSRYIKNGNQKVHGDKLVYNNLIRNILNSVEIKDEEKEQFKNVLENFIEVYKCFTQYIETHKTSQKQLNFLLAKDMIIPFFALFSSYIFDKHLIILEQLKPDENKKSFQKFLDWSERNICNQNIKFFLINKHEEDSYKDDNLSSHTDIERTIANWLSQKEQTTPNRKHLKHLVKNLEDCNKASHLNLYNLALFSKLFQEIHKKLELIFNKREIELLIEHYYCLLKFYSIKSVSFDIEETEYRIYNEVLNHINPNFINRNHYFDDYFAWIQKVVDREYIFPYKLVKNAFNKNSIYYLLPEKECMNFIEVSLPVLYFNKTKTQNLYVELFKDMFLKKEEININIQQENINLQMQLFFEHLDIKKEKKHNDKKVCNDIFKRLENEFKENDLNPYVCFLKTRYYIFDNNLVEALIYCEKCVNQGIGKLGENFKEAIMMGILLSAKNNTKTKYNFFRRMAIKYDSLTFGRLKIPAYGRGGKMISIPEDKSSFNELKEEYDEYFSNKFQ